jgi:hypothetical protein
MAAIPIRRKPDEDLDLKLVERLVFGARHDLILQRFGHAETVAGRTPDYRVLRGETLVAFCEVKSPRDDWLDEQIAAAPPGQIAGGPRSDPTFNRIARHVEKAASQFDAVNPDHVVPNILMFVNHADASGFGDLRETLTGVFHAEGGGTFPTLTHISDGWISEARRKIDLYVWIDRKTSRVQGYLFNELEPQYVSTICDLLGLDPNKIER